MLSLLIVDGYAYVSNAAGNISTFASGDNVHVMWGPVETPYVSVAPARQRIEPHRDPSLVEVALYALHGVVAVVDHRCDECRIRPALFEHIGEVLGTTGAARGNDRNVHRLRDHAGDGQLVTVPCPVGIDRVEDDFPGAKALPAQGPLERVELGGGAPTG